MRTIVPRDTSENPLFANPVMAIRADDQHLRPNPLKILSQTQEAEGGWMAGWVLMRFDKDGKMLWYRQLRQPVREWMSFREVAGSCS